MAIKIKRSSVPGKAPQTSDLELGELALNTFDGILYSKKDNGSASIFQINRPEWDTAYSERRQWDGGASNLNIIQAFTSLGLKGAATKDVGTTSGTVAAGDDPRFAGLENRLNSFRDSRKIYISYEGNDSNNGTSLGEPLRTFGAAAAASQPGDLIIVGPGTYIEESLPIRWKRNIGILAGGLRNTTIKPASGQEMNDIFKVDSGFWCWGLEFAGHQADSANGQQSWAISFDELADNTSIGAIGPGAYIFKSPYIQNCTSLTAEDDSGTAGSQTTGDTGGGIIVDGSKCAPNSPIRSMVVDSYTQVNLGGPGCLVLNDGYAQLVSFFGTFCQYHVRTESGGQVNLSGGGTSDFGIYGLMADGYSPAPMFTGKSRIATYGASRIDKAVTIDTSTDVFSCSNHTLEVNDQVTFSANEGTLPTGLAVGTTYYVISGGLTANAFKVSETQGGSSINMSGAATGSYQFVRQGSTQIDIIDFGANRLGRQIKYPTPGSFGSPEIPVPILSREGSSAGSKFTVNLSPVAGIKHEYTGGGTLTVGGQSYNVSSAVYNNETGQTTISASGYPPSVGSLVTLSGLSFICNSASRPNAGQLMFPQLVFPRNATTGEAQTKTFSYQRTGNYTLTYLEAASPSGPDHEYVSGGTAFIGGSDYGVSDASYDKNSGLVTITTKTPLPAGNGSITIGGLNFICPTSAYIVTSSIPIKADGSPVANDDPLKAGYRVFFYSSLNGGLKDGVLPNQVLDFRNRSQISAPSHTFEYVGSGTNYDALPWNGGVPIPANKIVATNNGRVYSSNTDELGNFKVGDQFEVDGTTGSVTINTDQFNLSGLNFIGPFSRNGGISTVGEQLREVSNNTALIASTGAPDGNTVPTQFAIKSYSDNRFLTNITATAGLPVTITDSSTQDSQGFWTRVRNINLSLNVANGLVRLNSSGIVPSALLPNTDSISEGSTNLYFTQSRARQSITVSGSLSYNPTTGVISYTQPTLPAGAIVGTTDTQTLTNKTFGSIRETILAITDAATVDINPLNGPIQTWTLGGNRIATANNFPAGYSALLAVDSGGVYSLTWPSITWVGSTSAPTLSGLGYTFIQLWKIGATLYGMAQK